MPSKKFIVTLLITISILTMLKLGFWQLNRAHLKTQRLAAEQSAMQYTQDDLTHLPSESLAYQRMTLSGQWMTQSFLWDNQIYQHQVGVDWLTPLQLDNGMTILVNEGWAARTNRQAPLPVRTHAQTQTTLTGQFYPAQVNRLIHQPTEHARITWPLLVQKLDLAFMGTHLETPLFPLIFYTTTPNDLTPHLPEVWLSPEKHHMYAVQWFSFAFMLLILSLYYRRRAHG